MLRREFVGRFVFKAKVRSVAVFSPATFYYRELTARTFIQWNILPLLASSFNGKWTLDFSNADYSLASVDSLNSTFGVSTFSLKRNRSHVSEKSRNRKGRDTLAYRYIIYLLSRKNLHRRIFSSLLLPWENCKKVLESIRSRRVFLIIYVCISRNND